MNGNLPSLKITSKWDKFKKWLKKIIIGTKGEVEEETEKEVVYIKRDNNFLGELENKTNYKEELLQKRIETGCIKVSDMTDEEYEGVVALYEAQIQEIRKKINKHKQKQ